MTYEEWNDVKANMKWEVESHNLWTHHVLSIEPPGSCYTITLTLLEIQCNGPTLALGGLILDTWLIEDFGYTRYDLRYDILCHVVLYLVLLCDVRAIMLDERDGVQRLSSMARW